MRSIKPGRGPSRQSFVGSIFVSTFGVFWTIMAFTITHEAPFPMVKFIFPLFGVLFTSLGIYQAVYSYKNATGEDRYSIVDIVDEREEGDPSRAWVRNSSINDGGVESYGKAKPERFCPYCGHGLESDFKFCPKCGKTIHS